MQKQLERQEEEERDKRHKQGRYTTSLFRAATTALWIWLHRVDTGNAPNQLTEPSNGRFIRDAFECHGLCKVMGVTVKSCFLKDLMRLKNHDGTLNERRRSDSGKRDRKSSRRRTSRGRPCAAGQVVTFFFRLCSTSQSWAWGSAPTATLATSCFLLILFLQSSSPLFFSRATLRKQSQEEIQLNQNYRRFQVRLASRYLFTPNFVCTNVTKIKAFNKTKC